ncbi:hypothetical protein HZ326_12106 [Fusarium oxysporum f. sp. albedinis]|nr:hypothetical protein HZ326_12106 [Fusarium oxysporum f. sp. albedinis]
MLSPFSNSFLKEGEVADYVLSKLSHDLTLCFPSYASEQEIVHRLWCLSTLTYVRLRAPILLSVSMRGHQNQKSKLQKLLGSSLPPELPPDLFKRHGLAALTMGALRPCHKYRQIFPANRS